MAASTITVKLGPSEYRTLRDELTGHCEYLRLASRNPEIDTPAIRHSLGERALRLEKILKEI